MNEKVKIRGKLLKFRRQMSESERVARSKKIAARLENLKEFKEANHVLFYYSVTGEADTRELIEKYIGLKQLYLPVVLGKNQLAAVPVKKPLDLRLDYEGMPAPAVSDVNALHDKEIEIVIVPGVAFDKKGNRIGRGKGYYDRYLQKCHKVLRIGLAFEEQVLETLPKDPYDETVDFIITDTKMYRCRILKSN